MRNDFSKGSVWRNIVRQAFPLMVAQLVQLMYNVVDRIYIGRLPDVGSDALTGIGLVFPITTLIAAFTNLVSTGAVPMFSIARGAKEEEEAERILGQAVTLLTVISFAMFVLCYIFNRPVLYMFGASDATYIYANEYLRIYLFGTTFSMLATGLNGFINAQGFPKIGMGAVMVGAIMNFILDPLFIYVLGMGVTGAAIATLISQTCSFMWVLMFFRGDKNGYRIKKCNLVLKAKYVKNITSLGLAGFVVQGTNCLVQVVCNKCLFMYGGNLYVGIMTVLNSIREILSIPGSTIGGGAQPILSYNYGAKKYSRVKQGIRFTASLGFTYLTLAWIFVLIFSKELVGIFSEDPDMIELGSEALKTYFFGFFFMAFQFVGQSTFTALRCAKRAIFFSIFRKVIIVVPLTIILPMMGLGVQGVFLAEPISNAIGGLACFTTMFFTLYRRLPEDDK